MLLLFPFYKWGPWSTERLNNFPKAIQLVSSRCRIYTPRSLAPASLHFAVTESCLCVTASPLPTCNESSPRGNYFWTFPSPTESLLSSWLEMQSKVSAIAQSSWLTSAAAIGAVHGEPHCPSLLGDQPRRWVEQRYGLLRSSHLMKGGLAPVRSFTPSLEPSR